MWGVSHGRLFLWLEDECVVFQAPDTPERLRQWLRHSGVSSITCSGLGVGVGILAFEGISFVFKGSPPTHVHCFLCREQFQSEFKGGVNYEIQNLTMAVKAQVTLRCHGHTEVLGSCHPRGALHPPHGSPRSSARTCHLEIHQQISRCQELCTDVLCAAGHCL